MTARGPGERPVGVEPEPGESHVSHPGTAPPLVRGHAAWALGEVGGASASATLRSRLGEEEDEEVREEIEASLGS